MRANIVKHQKQIFVNKTFNKSSSYEFDEIALLSKDDEPIAFISMILKDIDEDVDILLPEWFSNLHSINEKTVLAISKKPSSIPISNHVNVHVVGAIDLLNIGEARKEINSLDGIINRERVYIACYGHQVLVSIECDEGYTIFKTSKHTRISFSGYGVTSIKDVGGQKALLDWYNDQYLFSLKAEAYFTKWRIPTPRGILLSGKPGLGKTHFLKAIIADCGVHFISVSAPQIITPLAGEGDATLEKVFIEARNHAPTIICIDEIEALCLNRSGNNANYENRVVTVLLKEMDGLDTRGGVMVVGTTNRPEVIDPAFLRPGRFTYQIELEMPDEQAILEILAIHLRHINHNISEDQLKEISKIANGLTGAEIAHKIHSAAISTIRDFLSHGIDTEPLMHYDTLSSHF